MPDDRGLHLTFGPKGEYPHQHTAKLYAQHRDTGLPRQLWKDIDEQERGGIGKEVDGESRNIKRDIVLEPNGEPQHEGAYSN